MAKTNELEVAYRATTYRVFLPGGACELRIGEACPALQRWLAAEGIRHFALITAANPGSQRLDAARNAELQAALECELIEGGYDTFAAENVADAGDWPVEESCFVPDIAPEDALALAADFGQNAVLCGGADGAPQLFWTEAA